MKKMQKNSVTDRAMDFREEVALSRAKEEWHMGKFLVKVIQCHLFWYQSKAHMRLPISG